MEDILLRSKEQRKTFVVNKALPRLAGGRARLQAARLERRASMVEINLITSAHIRYAHRLLTPPSPLVGDRKYGGRDDGCDIAPVVIQHRIYQSGHRQIYDL